MKLHEKIKIVREDRRLSQEFVAYHLGLDQSQYSRRESGEVKFLAEEIILISKALEIKISKLYGEDQIDLNNLNQIGGTFSQYVTEVSHVLIEQFEKRLLEKDKIILELKQHRKIKYEPYFIS